MKRFATARLRMEPVTTANSDVLWNVLQHPGLREFQDLPDVDREHLRRMVEARPKRLERGAHGRFEWLLYERGRPDALGWVSLRVQDAASRSAEIGYSVIASARNRGLATEAVRGLCREGIEKLGLARIAAYCVPENVASRRVLVKAGFREGGVLRNGATIRGRTVNVVTYVMEPASGADEGRPA